MNKNNVGAILLVRTEFLSKAYTTEHSAVYYTKIKVYVMDIKLNSLNVS